ncbi:MAG: M24 family metallopeptidase, partial [Victivallaceae bacterium]
FWASQGATATAFPPIIAFGEDTAFPHASLSERKLCFEDIVLIDIGVELDDYCSDMTRVLNWGKPKKELRAVYRIVREAQIEGLKLCKAGVSCGAIHEVVCAVIKEAGYEKYFMHGTGHGIGMSVHEYPYLSSNRQDRRTAEILLKESMVVTVEPGIYLPGIGGVRLENSIIIKSDGYTDLTKREIPEELPCLYRN